jgi:hypothetical protein
MGEGLLYDTGFTIVPMCAHGPVGQGGGHLPVKIFLLRCLTKYNVIF